MDTEVRTGEGQGTDGSLAFGRQETDTELWLAKDEAAKLLGVHTRQIERREAAGFIRKQTLPREPGQTTARVVYNKSDLLALKAGAPNDYRSAGSAPGASGSGDAALAVSNDAAAWARPAAIAAVADSLVGPWLQGVSRMLDAAAARAASVPAGPRPWLTLEEAAEYSGLPAPWLLKQAQGGYVGAIDLGGRPRGGRWRFRLDELARIGS